jgi:diguanylate cyclase (GGDEF)-like protein
MKFVREQGRWRLRLGLRGQMLAMLGLMMFLVIIIFSMLWMNEKSNHREMVSLTEIAMNSIDRSNLKRKGESLATRSTPYIADSIQDGNSKVLQGKLQELKKRNDVVYAIAFDGKGVILGDAAEGSSNGKPMVDPLASAVMAAAGENKIVSQWNEKLLDIAAPVMQHGKRVGGLRIGMVLHEQSASNVSLLQPLKSNLKKSNDRHWRWLLATTIGMFLIALGLLYLLERHVIGPVRDLSLATDQMEQGRYADVNLSSNRLDEIGGLTRAFARMSAGVARHDREIRRMAYTDSLTGMANRLAFRELLEERLLTLQAHSGELALLFIDLDDFKRVNDTLGHEEGDEVLNQLALRVRNTLEKHGLPGSQVARFSGDEFILLFLKSDIRNSSSELAEELLAEVRKPLALHGNPLYLTASIGITLFPFDANAAGVLLKNADIAMYQAKVAGKNCYRFYSRAMDQAVERRVQLEQDLRGAFERGEMGLMYQPIYNLTDGRIVGAEALMRWQHPRLGMVPPSTFIEVAEQSGLIEMLGRHALVLACNDAAMWTKTDNTLPFISVNVSSKQLRGGELNDVIETVLASSGLKPSQLHLELTETAILNDENQASVLLSRVRATGVKVWLDDFGTGFSGLSHLRRVPVDGVKIDRSFVTDLLRDPDDLALTTSIIAMAHSLGITVVAEGIETEGQYAVLRERGCDQGQGFWLGRPMLAQEIAKLFAA